MDIVYKATGFELTPTIKEYTKRKFDFIQERYTTLNKPIACELGRTTNHHKHGDIFFAEIHFKTNKHTVYAREEKEDIYQAIDALQLEVLSQLEMKRGRMSSLWRKGSRKIKEMLKSPKDIKE